MKLFTTLAALSFGVAAPALADHSEGDEHHNHGAMMNTSSPAALGAAFCAAVVAEDVAALGSLYTEDADSYGPDGTNTKGPEAIGQSWAPFLSAFDILTCELNHAGLVENKKNATAWGTWSMTAVPREGGDEMTFTGRYMDISYKTKNGWRYRADHASNSAPPVEMADDTMAREEMTEE